MSRARSKGAVRVRRDASAGSSPAWVLAARRTRCRRAVHGTPAARHAAAHCSVRVTVARGAGLSVHAMGSVRFLEDAAGAVGGAVKTLSVALVLVQCVVDNECGSTPVSKTLALYFVTRYN